MRVLADNAVKIWSLEPHEDGIATFELLATLAFHQQAVNCVRWAGHGRCVNRLLHLAECFSSHCR